VEAPEASRIGIVPPAAVGQFQQRTKVASLQAFSSRVSTGYKPLEAYAKSVGEIANLAAIAEGYSPDVASERERAVYEKTLREGMDDPVHPHAERFAPLSYAHRRNLQNVASSVARSGLWSLKGLAICEINY
jgi:hypothetical protein